MPSARIEPTNNQINRPTHSPTQIGISFINGTTSLLAACASFIFNNRAHNIDIKFIYGVRKAYTNYLCQACGHIGTSATHFRNINTHFHLHLSLKKAAAYESIVKLFPIPILKCKQKHTLPTPSPAPFPDKRISLYSENGGISFRGYESDCFLDIVFPAKRTQF